MNRQLRKWQIMILCIILLLVTLPNTSLAQRPFDVQANAAILIDAKTGKILYQKNASTSLPVASMSKLMTQYVVLDQINKKALSWDDIYQAKDIDQLLSTKPGLSNIPLYQGEQYTLKELYDSMMIVSANASSRAVGEMVGKSDQQFVYMMNEQAKKLKLHHSHFVNTSGLNNKDIHPYEVVGTQPDDENHMSASDLALLAYHSTNQFPEEIAIGTTETQAFHVTDTLVIEMINSNQMLPSGKYPYEGILGMKTGMNKAAGYGFTAYAKRGNIELISVVIDAKTKDGRPSSKARFMETKKLLDYGFTQWKCQPIKLTDYLSTKEQKPEIKDGRKENISITTTDKSCTMIPKTTNQPIKGKLHLKEENMVAPITKGNKLGTMELTGPTEQYLTPELKNQATIDIISKESIEKQNRWLLFWKAMF